MIVQLEIKSWVGYCAGAKHFYGVLTAGQFRMTEGGSFKRDYKKDVTQILNRSNTIKHNKDEDDEFWIDDKGRWKIGDSSSRFHTEQNLRNWAVKMFEEDFDPLTDTLLYDGDHYNPGECLSGPRKDEMNEIRARWEECYTRGGDIKKDKRIEWEKCNDEWKQLIGELPESG